MAKAPVKDESDVLGRYMRSHYPIANGQIGVVHAVADNAPKGVSVTPDEPWRGEAPWTGSTPASGSGQPGSGGGGGSADSPTTPLDWRAYLENWGFDQDIVNELDRIFRTYSDSNAAGAAGLAYIRGTEWYKKTFPGIQEGMKLGLISNEAQYRAYTNQLNDLYQRYYGRTVTGDEVAQALKAGHAPSWLNSRFSGEAYIKANEGDIQYTLGAFDEKGRATGDELQALGDQQGGLDNMLGPEVQKRVALAQRRMAGIFQGVINGPNFQTSRLGRLVAPSLSGGNNPSDVGA